MSTFEQVLRIAQEQAAAVAAGDLLAATARLEERGALLQAVPPAGPADAECIREILRLDRVLSGQIRERMVAIRNESMEGQGIPLWLGMIRNLKPADTLEGSVLFDVEPKTYKLKLDDGSVSGGVQMVELPLQFDANKSVMPNAFGTAR